MSKLFTILVIVLASFVFLLQPALADDTTVNDALDPVCSNPNNAKSPVCKKPAHPNQNPVVYAIGITVDIMALITGFAAVLVIMIGGFTLITSSGNTEAVASARKRIVAAVIGLIIVALSWTIISFVIDKFIK